ncbi:hypothetical protein Taro_017057, partial [Colocasia esculenta]|nr:hypothetical protein [Colocasia esculenta]
IALVKQAEFDQIGLLPVLATDCLSFTLSLATAVDSLFGSTSQNCSYANAMFHLNSIFCVDAHFSHARAAVQKLKTLVTFMVFLKINGTLPDKPPPATPLPEQPTNDTPSSLSGAAMRLSSLRQLSSTFINSLRTRKPLSRKDAENINKWRFAKLKEHREGNIEVENEAFDRYMQNVHLLEETFSVNSLTDNMPTPEACSSEDDFSGLVTGIKIRLKSNPERVKNFRERTLGIVDEGLEKLKDLEFHDDMVSQADELDNFEDFKRKKKILKSRFDRTAAVDDLVANLIKARSEDDLKSCLERKYHLFNQDECLASCKSHHRTADVMTAKDSPDSLVAAFSYSLPKLFTTVQIGEDSMSNIDEEFCSLEQIPEL